MLEQQSGDFVVRRADGLFAYQLAVVVDDAAQSISEVVRGCDLLDLTSGQIYLQKLLGLPTPDYLHLPIVVNEAGEKLSKQTFARPLEPGNPLPELWLALFFLGQNPPTALNNANLEEFWKWAHHHWAVDNIPRTKTQTTPQ
jgi:glutamyl-Q tRNA(Asp) synthetase